MDSSGLGAIVGAMKAGLARNARWKLQPLSPGVLAQGVSD